MPSAQGNRAAIQIAKEVGVGTILGLVAAMAYKIGVTVS